MKLPVTTLIAAKNEQANIRRCLASLAPSDRVILLDSHSEDTTAEIAAGSGAEVIQFEYEGGYPKKRQWALDNLNIASPWILLLDADEAVPETLWDEIRDSISAQRADAFLVRKGFHFLGKRLRFGGFSHAAVLLFRRGKARFERLLEDASNGQDMEVHERVIVDGAIDQLKTPLIHQDFKGLQAYIDRHNRYSTWEAKLRHQYLCEGCYGQQAVRSNLFGNSQERRRFLKKLAIRTPFEPTLWFLYHFVGRLGFLHGRRGLVASQLRAGYIAQVRAKLYELTLQSTPSRRTQRYSVEPPLEQTKPVIGIP